MSRRISPKTSVKLTEEETALRNMDGGKLLFTAYQGRQCALLIQNGRLTEASFFPAQACKVGAVYIGKVKNTVKNIEACFVEIGGGELCFLSLKNASAPYLLNRSYDGRILEGDELLVQVIRDAQKSKKASVTADITLVNEYFVLSMDSAKAAYSSKLSPEKKSAVRRQFTEMAVIENGCLVQSCDAILSMEDAQRMESQGMKLENLRLPPLGVVVRTKTGELESAEELWKHFYSLTAEFVTLLYQAMYRSCFSCLKAAPAGFISILQEFVSGVILADPMKGAEFSSEEGKDIPGPPVQSQETMPQSAPDTQTAEKESGADIGDAGKKEIITDQESLYGQIKDYCDKNRIEVALRLYRDDSLSLSKLYSVESRLSMALDSRVWLKSGGYLVIEPTEALTVIDVNSGKYDADREARDTYLRINLEAAKEVALQLRLRNLSGIIIVDFINMQSWEDRKTLLDYLKGLTAQDRIQTKVIDMTPLGLVEITRKKIAKPLKEQYLMSKKDGSQEQKWN